MRTNIVVGLLAVLAVATAHAVAASSATNWYAEVETTAGSFTIQLDWEGAPNGCTAFAALAEGRTGWVNPVSGRAENGTEYFPETALSWVPVDESGEVLVLGNRGRVFTGADGAVNADNGAGLTLADDIRNGGGRGLAARSVALLNAGGPDTLDGRWAVMMKDADAYYGGRWSRIGTVVSNWDVVASIAGGARDAETGVLAEPAVVTGVRVRSDPPEALEAWRAGATNWPSCGYGDTGLEVTGAEGILRCGWSPKSQYAVVHGGSLMEVANNIVWMDWNDGKEEAWSALAFNAGEETNGNGAIWFGPRHFCAVAESEYPELGGPEFLGGEYGLVTEWQWGDGSTESYLYGLDWAAGTGTVWAATETGGWTEDMTVMALDQWRAGARSRELLVVCPMWLGPYQMFYVHYYQLGEPGANGRGRFRLDLHRYFADGSEFFDPVEVWGDYRWTRLEDESGKMARSRGMAGRAGRRRDPVQETGMMRSWSTPWARRGEGERLGGNAQAAEGKDTLLHRHP